MRLVLTTKFGNNQFLEDFFDINSHGVCHAIFISQKPSVFMEAFVRREGTPPHIPPLTKVFRL